MPDDDDLRLLQELERIDAELQRRNLNKRDGIGCYTDFVTNTLGVNLSPAQFAMCRVAFDGANPCDLPPAVRELAKQIFGDVATIEEEARSQFIQVAGARAGKTYLNALRILHLALTVDLSTLAPGEEALCVVIAPSLKLAEQGVGYIAGAISKVPALQAMLVGKASRNRVRIQRGQHTVIIEPRAAVRAGVGGRGYSIAAALMDEAAFFRDENYQVSDDEIFSAIYSRLLPGSQILVPSTPWTQSGLLFDKYKENWGHPKVAICAHAPTLLMLDTQRNRETIEQTRRDDPDKAAREYDAEFVSASAEAFFSPEWIDRSIDDSLPKFGDWREPQEGDVVKAGADFAFEGDSSALVITHVSAGLHLVAEIVEKKPSKDQPLKPAEVIESFADACERHHIPYVMADKHYRQSIIEHLNDYGMFFVDAPNTPADAFVTARMLLHQGRIRLPRHPRFLAQLREVRAKRTAGGGISILQPRKKGAGHGDIVSAFVLAVFQACGERIPYSEPDPNTEEGRKFINESLREQRRKDFEKEYDLRANPSNYMKVPPSMRIRNKYNRFH